MEPAKLSTKSNAAANTEGGNAMRPLKGLLLLTGVNSSQSLFLGGMVRAAEGAALRTAPAQGGRTVCPALLR